MINHPSVRDQPVVRMQIRLFIFVIITPRRRGNRHFTVSTMRRVHTHHHAMTRINVICE